MHKAGLFITLLGLLCQVAVARVDLTPEQLKEWQAFDRLYIRAVTFSGIETFTRSQLLSVIASEPPSWIRRYLPIGSRSMLDVEEFAKDLYRIEHFYQREGFPDVAVRGALEPNTKRNRVRLRIEVVEGTPIILERWSIEGDSGVSVDSAHWASRMPIKLDRRLSQSAVIASADTLEYKLRTISYARAKVDTTIEVDSARYRANVRFHLYPGETCFFGPTRIVGLKTVSEPTIRREYEFKPGEPYTPVKLEQTRENIVRMELFTLVSVRADTSAEGRYLPIWIDTRETRRYRLRASGGYDTEEFERVQTDFTDLNFFGRGRRLTWLNTYGRVRRGTEVRLFVPHTPWNATDLTLAPKWDYREEAGFNVDTRTNTTILSAEPVRKIRMSIANELGVEITREKLPDTSERIFKSVETFSIAWDTRDNALIPRRGHFLGATFTESGAFYGTEQRWWRSRFNVSAVQPIARYTSFATRSEFGMMWPLYEERETPLQERFRYGGATSVRGWGDDRMSPRAPDDNEVFVGGDAAFYVTAEIRRNVWGPVTLAAFVDEGNVWREPDNIKFLNLYPSAGLGLLFVTPVGPIRFDVAQQLRPNPYDDQRKRWNWHFSVGTPF